MIQALQELVRFFSQKHHTPIQVLSDSRQVDAWDRSGLVVAIPGQAAVTKTPGELAVMYDAAFAQELTGDPVTLDDLPVARIGPNWIVLLFHSHHPPAVAFARRLIEQHLPGLCRRYRRSQKDLLIEAITGCVIDRKRELTGDIRDNAFELERLSLQVMQLARKLETDRQLLRMFERSPEWIRARATRTFVDLMKLVPAVYAAFRIEDDSVCGTTHAIAIEHDGYTYHFDPFEVEVNLRQGRVLIRGGTNANGYVHPHVTDEATNICWGNIGHLVNRLAGELDLYGLFQLVHQFLATYNANDPYQRIEKWDPHWIDDEEPDEPFCSWCDDYGHTIGDCDQCGWCERCSEYGDHDEDDCPNCPQDEAGEEDHAVAAEQAA